MLKKGTHLLLALLMVIQILIPTTAFANEAEEFQYADVNAVELVDLDTDEDEVELEIEIDDNEEYQSWTDAELADWDELLADNTEIRDHSVYLSEYTELNEDAEDLHSRHVALYEISGELREDDIFEMAGLL